MFKFGRSQAVFAVPVDEQIATYIPLAYESFVTRIERQLTVEGMKVSEERLALSKTGRRLFGLLAHEMPGMVDDSTRKPRVSATEAEEVLPCSSRPSFYG